METLPLNNRSDDINDDDTDGNASWSCSTNWTVTRGTLDSVVTFESSDSPIEDSEPADSISKSPLVLKPLSPDAGSCEIKICFRQKHEVLQAYVRSTARVYEIYYAPSLQSSNNYLCTVCCCIAVRDGELLHAADIREAVPAHSEMTAVQMGEEKSADEGSNGTNEDDWVEIKVAAPIHDGNISLPNKTDTNMETRIQDLYEATAEITDSDPCMSLTLRLLSLENKGCVYIDEIYVFGATVELADTENQADLVSNASGSSLISMLVPTILQLSKSDMSRVQDTGSFGTSDKQECVEMGSQTLSSAIIANKNPQAECVDIGDKPGAKGQEAGGTTEVEPPKFQIPTEVSGGGKNGVSDAQRDLKYVQVETVLEQVVSRVSRIEDLCLRFEENMLKPINSIEARLQRVEKQLKVLSKNSQHSGLQPCMRISAPPFPCSDSDSSSFYNDGCDFPPHVASELKDCLENSYDSSHNATISRSTPKKNSQHTGLQPCMRISAPPFPCSDSTSSSFYNDGCDFLSHAVSELKEDCLENLYNSSHNATISRSTSNFLPKVVGSAPEFSCGGDEEENRVVNPQKDSPDKKLKHTLSIDDALAAAYFGFLSKTIVQPPKYTQALQVMAPEFISEESGDAEHSEYSQTFAEVSSLSPSGHDGNDEGPKYLQTPKDVGTELLSEELGNDCAVFSPVIHVSKPEVLSQIVETNEAKSSLDSVPTTNDASDAHFVEMSGVEARDVSREEGSSFSSLVTNNICSHQVNHDTAGRDNCPLTDECNKGRSNVLFSERSNIARQCPEDLMVDNVDATVEDHMADSVDTIVEEVSTILAAEEGSDVTLHNVYKSSCLSSVLDFDVEFSSSGSSSTMSLEAVVLAEVAKDGAEAPCRQENEGALLGIQESSVLVGHGEPVDHSTDNHLLVDLHFDGVGDTTANGDSGSRSPSPWTNQEIFASLI